ncbi:probable C-_U-editing enzyme APOBEC-2 [Brienomyrus brachyistius]|uniref:probable C->U-editing enzyme APOBEC-2 n=1 Tax=Brienomyrus brachyistius TaxID=42636 RepID=UPI0020B24512|nr:probable C->U-editing enzyme APOBEC-2 [Brienomyrus brachyistius]
MADSKETRTVGQPAARKQAQKEEAMGQAVGALAKGTDPQGNGETPELPSAGEEGAQQEGVPELPPFEIIRGDRIDPFFFKFQFKNVEYSSGRNKTFLCFLVDSQSSNAVLQRGYLEDEHVGSHAEEAFFQQVLPQHDTNLNYMVTWYVSSSPCASCAAKLVEILQARRTLRLTIYIARLFMWEEPEIRAGLKALAAAGCKLRMMKPLDFTYTWDTFVENEEQSFALWEDCKDNYEYYQEKLAEILE